MAGWLKPAGATGGFAAGVSVVLAFLPEAVSSDPLLVATGISIGLLIAIGSALLGTYGWLCATFEKERVVPVLAWSTRISLLFGACVFISWAVPKAIVKDLRYEGFVYIKASERDLATKTKFAQILSNPNGYAVHDVLFWVSPIEAGADSNRPEYYAVDSAALGNMPTTYSQGDTHLAGRTLGIGAYQIEINGRYATYLETLRIEKCKGELIQRIEVMNRETEEIVYDNADRVKC